MSYDWFETGLKFEEPEQGPPTYFGLGANHFAWGERRELRFDVVGLQIARFGVPSRLTDYLLHQITCETPSGRVAMLAQDSIPVPVFSFRTYMPHLLWWPDRVTAIVFDVQALPAPSARPAPIAWWRRLWLWLTLRPRPMLPTPAAPAPFVGALYVVPEKK